MTNPKLDDPDFLLKRETQWQYYASIPSDLTKSDLEYIRPIFFEQEFDYGNKKKYGRFATDYRLAFELCPIQTVEHWGKWFEEWFPCWLGKDYVDKLSGILLELGFYPKRHFWTVSTSAELFKFCFGEQVTLADYKFLSYTLPHHPILRYRCLVFYKYWLNHIACWLSGISEQSEEYYAELAPMWISILGVVHPVYFNYEINQDTIAEQSYLQEILLRCRGDYSFETVLLERGDLDREEIYSLVVQDDGRRARFVDSLAKALSKESLPVEFMSLWEKAKSPDFIVARNMEVTPRLEKQHRIKKADLGKWTDERIKQLRETL